MRPVPVFVTGGVVLFAVGVLTGMYGLQKNVESVGVAAVSSDGIESMDQGEVDISGVEFIDSDASDGRVEFVFEAVRPVRIKGTLDDPRIQKVLAHAVVNEQNSGVRLRAISTAGAQGNPTAEGEIKRALITALKSDPNTGVRNEAYAALMKYPFDDDIKAALIHVLTYDENPKLRIEAVSRLEMQIRTENRPDPVLVDVFKSRMETDQNTFVRTKARTVVESLANP